MRKLFPGLALISLCLLSACFFNDKEVYSVDPVAGERAELTVESNLDTLVNPPVGDSLEVSYSAEVSNGEFYFLDALVDQELIHSSDSIQGSFWVYPSYSAGVDTLFLEFYISSNTNTLADRTGFEAALKVFKYAIDFGGGSGR